MILKPFTYTCGADRWRHGYLSKSRHSGLKSINPAVSSSFKCLSKQAMACDTSMQLLSSAQGAAGLSTDSPVSGCASGSGCSR